MAECVVRPVSNCEGQLPGVRKRTRKVTVNVAQTQYSVIKEVAHSLGWRLSMRNESWDWDVLWSDTAVPPETLTRMKPYQKINHFPGTYMITRKNLLARSLNKMRKLHPADYNFYPRTWELPTDYTELKSTNLGMYIVKPEASCQGKGIFLSCNLEEVSSESRCVVQEYVKNPLLLDGFKFDMRIYVLLAGCNPLRAFIHREGLVRLATNKYAQPTAANLHEQYMHLTNYAINKTNAAFVQNEDPSANCGHKRSLSSLWDQLQAQGCDTGAIWTEIKSLVARTLLSIQPSLAHMYKACQPNEPSNSMCFELLGFDILLDTALKPWLLEVNHSPSLTTDSQLDAVVKHQVIRQTFAILNINSHGKQQYQLLRKVQLQQSPRDKQELRQKRQSECLAAQDRRDEWERSHLGNFEKVELPVEEETRLVKAAYDLWERWTGPARPRPLTQSVQRRQEFPQTPQLLRRELRPELKPDLRQTIRQEMQQGLRHQVRQESQQGVRLRSRQETRHEARHSEVPHSFQLDLLKPGRTSPIFHAILQEKRVLQAVQRQLMSRTQPVRLESKRPRQRH